MRKLQYPLQLLGLIISYILAGKAGLLLAIPPGYASAIFPASGVALYALLIFGSRLWPAIFIGSTLLNISVGADNTYLPDLNEIICAMSIALGSTLQALFATYLFKRKLKIPLTFLKTKEIFLFMAIIAPASCLIGSTFGATTLLAGNLINAEQWLFSWFNWWVGDTLGLLVVLPVALSLYGLPESVWKPRRFSVALPLTILTVMIIVVFFTMSQWEQEKISDNFLKQSELRAKALEYSLDQYLAPLYALQAFVSTTEDMNYKKFEQYTRQLLKRNTGIHALSWNPLISDKNRKSFEQDTQLEFSTPFQIRERDKNNELVQAGIREQYVVVKYIQPLAGNENAVGFDVNSNLKRKQALNHAKKLRNAVGTESITLVQETASQAGLLIFLPVFDLVFTEQLRGYVVGVFRIGALLDSIFYGSDFDRLHASLMDISDESSKPVPLAHYGYKTTQDLKVSHSSFTVTFATRRWEFNMYPSVTSIEEQRSLSAWFILASGLLVTTLCAAILLFLTGRAFEVTSIVRQRTAELKDSEMRTKAILNNAVDGVITIDAKGIIESANPAACRLFKYKLKELTGQNIKILMPEKTRVQHDKFLENYHLTGKKNIIGKTSELYAQDKHGSPVFISLSVSEVRLAGRTIFTGVVHDLREQQKIQQELHNTLIQLQESRSNLLLTLNQFRVATIILNEQGIIEFASQSCHDLPGWVEKSPTGKIGLKVLPFSLNALQTVEKALQEGLSEQRISINWRNEFNNHYWVDIDIKVDPQNPHRHILYLYDVSEVHSLRELVDETHYREMIGQSQVMKNVFVELEKLAAGSWNVLIEGETGTGKELAARAIHASSKRKNGPFIAVNTAGLTDTLLASQLFGHKKGAFTGAIQDQKGLFESAAGGTLFLDEIGDISPQIQKNLLRVLQEREVMRLGDNKAIAVDARVIAATNKNLQSEVNEHRFREDLFYRLRVGRIELPPLRKRNEDITLLIEHFLAESRVVAGKPTIRVEKKVMDLLRHYPWPGNIRELKNLIEHIAIHCQEDYVTLKHLPPELLAHKQPSVESHSEMDERNRIINALQAANGKRAHAAKLLGISRATFYRKIKEHNIPL